jgi:thiamine-phosphate pyrophosphorylase
MLPVFYPIFDSAQWLERLLPLGIKLVQLRIKDESPDTVKREIAHAQELTQQYDCQLIVNDYWQEAIELGCDYVHLGQEDLEGADVKAIKSAGVKLGVSTHSGEELDTALSVDPDYVALGPVYPTILKKMPWQPQGLERVGEWKKAIGDTPLVAIGGLTLERAQGVIDAGADVVSLVTDITLNPDPEERTRQWVAFQERNS